jgi:hypothetical protein
MVPTKQAVPRPAEHYQVPALLQDIHLLDLLELSGTTVQASTLLHLSQPTVSRRYRALARDFQLQTDRRQHCQFGYRDHRLEGGVARIGTDPRHHPLLAGLEWLLPAPARFRPIETWFELVRQGVLDGAVIYGLELRAAPAFDSSDLQLVALGDLPLAPGLPPVLVLPQSAASASVLVHTRDHLQSLAQLAKAPQACDCP